MRQQTLRFGESWAHIAPWRGGGGAAQLVVGPDARVTTDVIDRCLERARACGYASVFTSAVTPAEAGVFVDTGFSVRERLHLLARDLDTPPPAAELPLERAHRRDRAAVIELDNLSFDAFWRLGPIGLRDAISATPISRFRVGRGADHLRAYAITGLADRQGYLQRVAVHPDDRREGWGRALVADGLEWLWEHAAERAYVNTQLENHRSIALYESFGFTTIPAGLCVFGRTL